ncbi:MAG: hypothetical protein F4X65_04500 [Chloroflexi bacterium]|nr:hypothetical protein [Chloroflexota bacterium]
MAKQKEQITMSRAFLEGLARIFDPFSSLDSGPYSGPRKKTDTEMLRSDWNAIGRDMQKAFDSMGQKDKENAVR